MLAGAPIADIMYNMLDNMLLSLGTAEFRRSVSDPKLRALLADNPVVEVGRYKNEATAVVLSPDRYAELRDAADELDQVRSVMPLLLSAVRAGADIPSHTLEAFGFDPTDASWQTLNWIQHQVPISIDADETGDPVTHARLPLAGHAEELGEELVLADD